MRTRHNRQSGFTLVEMIVVMVITGIIGGMVAMFIRAPVQGYMDSARRAEMTDIADTALRRLARDIRTAVPNSVRLPNPDGSSYIEFLPTKDGGRYRAQMTSTGTGDMLDFGAADGSFDIIGTPITFTAGDQIVIGSTQSDGNPPYQDPTSAACSSVDTSTCIRRTATTGVSVSAVNMTPSVPFPAFAEVPPGQRFYVVPGDQQAVTYACETAVPAAASGDGPLVLRRYWSYGFNATQVAPPLVGSSAILADKVSASACEFAYDARNALVTIRLGITRGGESMSLYHQVHVINVP